MFIKEKYINRHAIIEALQLHFQENDSPNAIPEIDLALTFDTLCTKANLSTNEVLAEIDFLLTEEQIAIIHLDNTFSISYIITQKGTIAYHNKTHIGIGKKRLF